MAAGKGGECVKVVIRCRPMSKQELIDNREEIVLTDTKEGVARLCRPGTKDFKDFTFDAVYDASTEQAHFYKQTGYPVVESVLDGFNGTIFAYGQTGTGKTHSMVGSPDSEELRGLIPRTFGHIFEHILTSPSTKFLVRASYLEIYNEEIRDLLSKSPKQKLDLKDHPDGGVYVRDLSNLIVKDVPALQQVMEVGQRNRSVASTMMNSESSRSHSIFTITVETAETGADSKDHIRVGKMNMVDLAGSERQSKTGASGETLKEATKINMSLSALGNVISALVDAKTSFVPYRDSKLTRLLQDSLGGNTKTVMCACVGPVDYNYDETLSTLRYAYRAKSIKNKPKINEDPKDAMIRDFQDEIARLKLKLAEKASGAGIGSAAAGAVRGSTSVVEKEVVEVERVVEKEVVVEVVVNSGVTDADIEKIQAKLDEERRQVEEELAAEARQIEEQKNLADEKKQQLLLDFQAKAKQREQEAEAHGQMMQQLRAMEEKMLVGSQVMEKAMQQENELIRAEIEVDERKRAEKRMREELERQVEDKINLEEKHSSAEEQVHKMTAKLEKLWYRHKDTQQEIADLQQEFQGEREDMLEIIRELRKEVKLVCLTIDSFIPQEQYDLIVAGARYDESTDEWVIENVLQAGRGRPRRGRRQGERDSDLSLRSAPVAPGGYGVRGARGYRGACDARPSMVYFAYTEEGQLRRLEGRAGSRRRRECSSQRPKTGSARATQASSRSRSGGAAPDGLAASMRGRLGSTDSRGEGAGNAFPKARGLVQAS